jgi:hypothetical protein
MPEPKKPINFFKNPALIPMVGQSSEFTTRRRGKTRQLTFAIALSTRGAILRQGSQSRTSACGRPDRLRANRPLAL